MKECIAYIETKQARFRELPLFARMRRDDPVEWVTSIFVQLTFWPLVVQDLFRLVEEHMVEPEMKKIARMHRKEDAGHDRWILDDIEKFSGGVPTVQALFGPSHTRVRDASYALTAEVFRSQSDAERAVLLLAIESTGHVLLETSADYFERRGMTSELQYFGRRHIEVEHDHDIFGSSTRTRLSAIVLSDEERQRTIAMIDRAYDAFHIIVDAMEKAVQRTQDQHRARAAGLD